MSIKYSCHFLNQLTDIIETICEDSNSVEAQVRLLNFSRANIIRLIEEVRTINGQLRTDADRLQYKIDDLEDEIIKLKKDKKYGSKDYDY